MDAVLRVVTEHTFQSAVLLVSIILTTFVGYLVYRVHRSSQQLEGLIAATYLEARRALEAAAKR
ncbi:MAG: hypothetical protein HYU41_11050 [Candidatus Rokubacteria bacterium]|nr:hypothetical protein [Candidatus Rokubacteria bacterium]